MFSHAPQLQAEYVSLNECRIKSLNVRKEILHILNSRSTAEGSLFRLSQYYD